MVVVVVFVVYAVVDVVVVVVVDSGVTTVVVVVVVRVWQICLDVVVAIFDFLLIQENIFVVVEVL